MLMARDALEDRVRLDAGADDYLTKPFSLAELLALARRGPVVRPTLLCAGDLRLARTRGGAGLGLAIVRAVAAAHGGHAEIVPDPAARECACGCRSLRFISAPTPHGVHIRSEST
jgi:hypothetical protein